MTEHSQIPLPEAERRRIAAAYGAVHVPATVTLVPRGCSGIGWGNGAAPGPASKKPFTFGRKPSRTVEVRRNKVAELAHSGLGPTAIARRLDLPLHIVSADYLRLGLPRRKNATTPELAARRARVLELLGAGRSQTQIAAELGVPGTTVLSDLRALKREGLT